MYIDGKFNAALSSFDCVQLVCDRSEVQGAFGEGSETDPSRGVASTYYLCGSIKTTLLEKHTNVKK